MATQTEVIAIINQATEQLGKIKEESSATLQKVSDLEAALANQDNASPALVDAVNALKAQVQVVDDLVADAPIVPPIDGNVNTPA